MDRIEMLYDNMDRFDKQQMSEYLIKDGYPEPYTHTAEFKYQNEIRLEYLLWQKKNGARVCVALDLKI